MSNTASVASPLQQAPFAVSDAEVNAAFCCVWPCLDAINEIIDVALRPARLRLHKRVAERVAELFNAVRVAPCRSRADAAEVKLNGANVLPADAEYANAHEEAAALIARFVRIVEGATDRRAGFHWLCPAYQFPPLTAAVVQRGRIRLSVRLKRHRKSWERVGALLALVRREAVACGLASPPGVVIATKTLLSWRQIEQAAQTHCPLYAGMDASEVRKDLQRLSEVDPDNCPIRFPTQGGQPLADYQRLILWLASASENLGLR